MAHAVGGQGPLDNQMAPAPLTRSLSEPSLGRAALEKVNKGTVQRSNSMSTLIGRTPPAETSLSSHKANKSGDSGLAKALHQIVEGEKLPASSKLRVMAALKKSAANFLSNSESMITTLKKTTQNLILFSQAVIKNGLRGCSQSSLITLFEHPPRV